MDCNEYNYCNEKCDYELFCFFYFQIVKHEKLYILFFQNIKQVFSFARIFSRGLSIFREFQEFLL
jgi:hypothetical protein